MARSRAVNQAWTPNVTRRYTLAQQNSVETGVALLVTQPCMCETAAQNHSHTDTDMHDHV